MCFPFPWTLSQRPTQNGIILNVWNNEMQNSPKRKLTKEWNSLGDGSRDIGRCYRRWNSAIDFGSVSTFSIPSASWNDCWDGISYRRLLCCVLIPTSCCSWGTRQGHIEHQAAAPAGPLPSTGPSTYSLGCSLPECAGPRPEELWEAVAREEGTLQKAQQSPECPPGTSPCSRGSSGPSRPHQPGGKCRGLKPGRRNGGGGGGGTPGANPGGGIPKGAVKAGGWSAPTTGGPDGWGGT